LNYPADFTKEDIMEFEYEYNRWLDLQDPNSPESINAELQELAHEAWLENPEWDAAFAGLVDFDCF